MPPAIAGGADFVSQLIGILAIGVFVFGVSYLVWFIIEKTLGARVSREVEEVGQDAGELGIEAYPEFMLMPDPDLITGTAARDPPKPKTD